jgi:lincosamide and streptogramin A transport system ATP-binding/permease protein
LTGSAHAEPLFDAVSFKLLPGERLVISGPNGSGKTTLLNLLAGQPVEHQGVFERPGQVRTSRVCQRPRWQQGQLGDRLRQSGLDEARFRQIMAALGVRGTVLDQPLAQLSQGQLKKIELARSFIEPAHLLIWDEPLNYIDVDTREQIETVLLECPQALVCVEHDAHFVEHVATSVIHLTPCGDGGN